ncbi:hypothetical protein L1887_05602 [Cichorium endivia]|nr:hypothetical protein L1887_05602 [Cichorium endivia]
MAASTDDFTVSCLNVGHSQEIFSFSFGGSSDNLLTAGCKSQVLGTNGIWELMNLDYTLVQLDFTLMSLTFLL